MSTPVDQGGSLREPTAFEDSLAKARSGHFGNRVWQSLGSQEKVTTNDVLKSAGVNDSDGINMDTMLQVRWLL